MALELMKMTPPEDLMKLMELQDSIKEEMYRVTGISEMLLALPEPGERSIWRESIWIGYG